MSTSHSAAPPTPAAHRAALARPCRLEALRASGLLDGVASPALDRLTRLVSRSLGAPVALVSLVDDRAQHFPGLTGLGGWAGEGRGTPLSHSFCQYVVVSGEALVVDDAAAHPLVRGNAAVADLNVRAYLGVPLTTASGETLGALCAIDTAPRAWTADDLDGLRDLARTGAAELEVQIALGAAPDAAAAPASARAAAAAPAAVFDEIARRGDRLMAAFLAFHTLLALALAPVHGTWAAAAAVAAGSAAAFALARRWRPGGLAARVVAGLGLQAFCALHIHQMHGLAEMHFFYFTSTTAMIIYQDWRAAWPGILAIIAQHTLFSWWHNQGEYPGGAPFFEPHHVTPLKLAFHYGVALVQAAVASYWAHVLRRRTLADAEANGRLRAQATALEAQVAARDAAHARLAGSEARFRALSTFAPLGVFQGDLAGALTYVNPRAQELWGAPEGTLLGRGWLDALHPDDADAVRADAGAALAAGREYAGDFRVVRPDGTVRHVRGRGAPLRDAAGRVAGAVGTVEDVTERHAAAAALADSERRFRTVVESIDQGLLVTDRAGRIQYANTRAAEITGYAPDELVGRVSHEALLPADERAAGGERLARRLQGRAERYEVDLVRKDGTRVSAEVGSVPFRDAAGATVGAIAVVADTTARKALEAELTRRAFEDPLTGLANRARFRACAERALERAGAPAGDARAGAPAVLLIDLDDFKTVNDSLGHAAGDRLLALVAERLLHATRGADTVARLGGDEFAVLLGAVRDAADAARVAERVGAALAAPLCVEGREVRVGASVGIAVGAAGETPDELLRNADLALYRVKARGEGGHELFARAMHAAAVERLELETELREAIAAGALALHYQPIVDPATGATRGVEALARWPHPARGLVPPSTFIPLAEATDLIAPLGRWALDEACRAAAGWPPAGGAGGAPPTVTVNVSGRQLGREAFVGEVAEALRASGLAPGRLVLEVTESVLLADADAALERLGALRALGVRLALDDFGTGYSSLSYLQRLPVDVLKIDRSFTAGVAAGGRGATLARALVALAESLGLRTVAEGVQTPEQHAALRAIGCRFAQGYLYARPMPGAALARHLAAAPAAPAAPAAA